MAESDRNPVLDIGTQSHLTREFSSVEDLCEKISNCIDYFHKMPAKPFRWTY
jgi:hypothetical protein